ncbi:ABC transporter ATP-binding protein [Hathewaya massiliensis]|uniref:ABC transporter ATP-binding protein n=1 Tax=Hathewaya massiliensis TaxID=1964382 RepID=UPI0011574564|nr:ABC transporter ATP-binding protein [Hathewaya massiliensis]
MEIIRTIDLCKTYGKGDLKVEALKNINISIEKGEFVAIVGPSGSGKSTLLHILGGLDKATSGKIIINNHDIFSFSEEKLSVFRRRNIGFIFQFYNLIPVLNIEENIALPLMLDNIEIEKEYLEELLEILDLKERRKHIPSQLSGGQQQRVSIGRALAYKPPIILADEPTGNLDSKNSREVIELLRYSAKKYHQTLILITHDLNIAEQADRIIRIEDGEIAKNEVVRND